MHPREETIFNAALDQPSEAARAVFLDVQCGGDAMLREQVEMLLLDYKEGQFLERRLLAENVAPLCDSAWAEQPLQTAGIRRNAAEGAAATMGHQPLEILGTIIGHYKLLEQIGEGGMGAVYVAEQKEPVRRTVALKVIKPGMDTRQVVARFEAERQALAMMNHSNIAKVLDAGATELGRPYFVMELVKGVPITEFCDEQKLDTRQRLQLFTTVCQAVQHAHQKGLIHRDIKPSNVLVEMHDVTPVPKVIDFGVAKAIGQQLTEKTLHTGFSQMVGTPLYMSPEQAGQSSIDVDTRSDVYSLGVLLYEILTGHTPFESETLRSAGFDEMRRIIREVEPPRPSARISTLQANALSTISDRRKVDPRKLSQQLRGELDWIVMKALEKDRNRRYDSASSLAADIHRYLDDEPVHACPPSTVYRMRKFVRRNKSALTAVVAVFLVLLLTVLAATGFGYRRLRQQAQTEREVALALQEATIFQGERKWPMALAAVKRAEALLASHSGSRALERRTHDLRRDLVTAFQLEETRLRATGINSVNIHAEIELDRLNGMYTLVFQHHGIDLETLEPPQAAGLISAQTIRGELIAALDHWAGASIALYQTNANQKWKKLLQITRLADPDDWRKQLRLSIERRDVDDLKKLACRDRAKTLHSSTLCLFAQALEIWGARLEAMALLQAAQRRDPGDYWINVGLGAISAPDLDAEVRFLTAALAIRPQNNADAHANLGLRLLQRKESMDEAISQFREVIRIRPDNPSDHKRLIDALEKNGMPGEAESACREAIRLMPNYYGAYLKLADTLVRKGMLDAAESACRDAIRLMPNDFGAYSRLGWILNGKGLQKDAIATFELAIRLSNDGPGVNNNLGWFLATCPDPPLRNIAQATAAGIQVIGEPPDWGPRIALHRAEEWKDAISTLERSIDPPEGGHCIDSFFLAMAHWQLDQKEEAHKCYDQAVEWMDTNIPSNEELRRFRAAAAELLGVNDGAESQTELPP